MLEGQGINMLKEGMYVRCSIDEEDPEEPRLYITGQIYDTNWERYHRSKITSDNIRSTTISFRVQKCMSIVIASL